MEYPHKTYIRYLLSRRMSPYEIMADCSDKSLLPPNEDDLRRFSVDLGPIPPSWTSSYSRSKNCFKRWLKQNGLTQMWKSETLREACTHFIYRLPLRKDFEALILMHGDLDEARDILEAKHGSRIPDSETLNLFYTYFWNIGSMSAEGLFNFLKVNDEKKDLLPAYQGDLSTVYGRLGLRQRIEAENFYDNIIALANHQVQEARKSNASLNGTSMMGLAALTRQALDALKSRDELHMDQDTPFLDSLRDQASAFRMKILEEEDIPTYDSIKLIDLGEEDGRNTGNAS